MLLWLKRVGCIPTCYKMLDNQCVLQNYKAVSTACKPHQLKVKITNCTLQQSCSQSSEEHHLPMNTLQGTLLQGPRHWQGIRRCVTAPPHMC
mmetsp:Transcript_72706/g.122430  ORF Transcript_72706/g.122430 Transcript_72706/m.122430 type:complete len:92 (+) Transcript_72706:303-578(+)